MVVIPSTPSCWVISLPAGSQARTCRLLAALPPDVEPGPITEIGLEIVGSPDSSWSVLISVIGPAGIAGGLTAIFGVSNDPAFCDRSAELGLPIVDGDIEFTGSNLTVRVHAYPARQDGASTSPVLQEVLKAALTLDKSEPAAGFDPLYGQAIATPDVGRPDKELVGQRVSVSPDRRDMRRALAPDAVVSFARLLLYPDLFTLVDDPSAVKANALWTGVVEGWRLAPGPTAAAPAARVRDTARFNRTSTFGPPSFAFDEVELVGFRLEVPKEDLIGLIKPLNFHRCETSRDALDFTYEVATGTLIIELLRYGKMRTRDPAPPFTVDDFMSQHELLARVLVGRVDDDTPQAREPAMFVPAIFVDNPWSKAVGRRLQGFSKLLAEFQAEGTPLGMDGRVPGTAGIVPFRQITAVHLRETAGKTASTPLVSFDCPDKLAPASEGFFRLPLQSILDGTERRRSRFDQFDFEDDVVFRRAFAGSVLLEQFNKFRSVQVAPVDTLPLPKAWITGNCTLRNLEVAFPVGVATLQFKVPDAGPRPGKSSTKCYLLRPAA